MTTIYTSARLTSDGCALQPDTPVDIVVSISVKGPFPDPTTIEIVDTYSGIMGASVMNIPASPITGISDASDIRINATLLSSSSDSIDIKTGDVVFMVKVNL